MLCVFYRGCFVRQGHRQLRMCNHGMHYLLMIFTMLMMMMLFLLLLRLRLLMLGQERSRDGTGRDGTKSRHARRSAGRQSLSACLWEMQKQYVSRPFAGSRRFFFVVFVVFLTEEGGKERRAREGRRRKERENPIEMFSFFQLRNESCCLYQINNYCSYD